MSTLCIDIVATIRAACLWADDVAAHRSRNAKAKVSLIGSMSGKLIRGCVSMRNIKVFRKSSFRWRAFNIWISVMEQIAVGNIAMS